MRLCLGVKADPIEYRYSYPWLFRIMAEEGVRFLQFGTFFEMYQLPDEWFVWLKHEASKYEIRIASIFTAHRELGGFFRGEPAWEKIARRNYERLIEIGALLGAASVGSNPGAVLRDHMHEKSAGIERYLGHMKSLMHYARRLGIERLTIEPMSCNAEPPTFPDEIVYMAESLLDYHRSHDDTVRVGYCVDVSHGYADAERTIRHSNLDVLLAAIPYLAEIHLKNTDACFDATFGFTESERERGIVNVDAVRTMLIERARESPEQELIGYFEITGPKLGRDYTDGRLEGMLRESLRFLKRFET